MQPKGTLTQARIILAARKGTLFSVRGNLHSHIVQAGRHINSYFDIVGAAVDKGKSSGVAVRDTGHIRRVIRGLSASAHLHGYQDAAKYVGKRMPALYGKKVNDYADRRSAKVDRWMRDYTAKQLDANPDSDFILSAERANRAANYEAGRAYFIGLQDAIKGSGLGKMWITSGGNSCPYCLANEEAGIVDADDDWDGDDVPPLHLSCGCSVGLVKL